ncbi:beta-ketoacyl-[acyl-carrier-protein] synthase family protein [Burkholderia sp. BCC0405]|uniref:beta-ketoacyl-[acyl-carrier-protein] synthase family protein n=1 Tax=Burkholderia sp. BCC0405 TaxID=2676298 RepID=UPI00158E8762|nr:beta-ketoacyl-[acyl-carrier-protein] synthase family protein [Burkholderia sp. BCC0405]
MTFRKVVVTGLGVVSALGVGSAAFWRAMSSGRHGFTELDAEGGLGPLRIKMGARIRDFDPAAHLDPRKLDLLDRFSQFALVAASEAMREARLDPDEYPPHRMGVVLGSSMGGQTTQDSSFLELYRNGKPRVNPGTIPRIMANAAVSNVCMAFHCMGPSFAVSTACASSNHAIGLGMSLLRSGAADMMIVGGSEAPFSHGHLKAWEAMRVVASDLCRPFSADRDGMLLGEGAGILVLETLERAKARGATIFAEVAGFGMSADARHLVMPSVDGPAQAIRAALDDAGLTPSEIDYINCHGTGTVANDVTEVASVRDVFGAHADKLQVSSTKSMHGHALGAAGALEAVALALSIHEGVLPPTANFSNVDPACALDVIPNVPRRHVIHAALSNSFGFGGLNAVLALRHPEASCTTR